MLKPCKTNNRSMLYRVHQKQNADFIELANECILVGKYNDLAQEEKQMQKLALVDLTNLMRIGFKGNDTPEWLTQQNITLPDKINQATRLEDKSLVAKLSTNEYLFLNSFDNNSGTCTKLKNNWQFTNDKLCYILNRQHSHNWFLLTGEHCYEVMAKLCGVDLRDNSFLLHSVAQTSVARVNSIVIKDKIFDTPMFHLLVDSASSEYFWFCLLDAMEEFSGLAIGIEPIVSNKS